MAGDLLMGVLREAMSVGACGTSCWRGGLHWVSVWCGPEVSVARLVVRVGNTSFLPSVAPLPWCEWSERGYNVVEQSAGAAITLPVQQDSAGESNLPSHSNSPSLSLH